MRPGAKLAGVVSVAVIVVAACGSGGSSSGSGDGFPLTVQNCGHDVRIDHRPERIVALGPSEVTTLYTAGVAPKMVGRDDQGKKSAPYPPDMRAAVSAVPQLGTGGEVTRESIIALQPDLVVGSVSESVTPDSLGAVGIPMISLRGNCGSNHAPGSGDGTADFDDVISDVDLFGTLAGTGDRASAAVADMRRQIAAARPPATARGRSAAAVVVFDKGLEVYGRPSMAHTQFQTLGLRDVFGDANNRVFEASIEELIARNPDTILILSYGESDEQAKSKFLAIPGVANLAAVRNNALIVQPYEYSSQGALSVNGLGNLARSMTTPQ